jgi:hypothetical protein
MGKAPARYSVPFVNIGLGRKHFTADFEPEQIGHCHHRVDCVKVAFYGGKIRMCGM